VRGVPPERLYHADADDENILVDLIFALEILALAYT
jgi:hypothetical protein